MMKKRNVIRLGMLVVGGLMCQTAWAACFLGPQDVQTKTISLGNVIIQRDTPPGSVVATATLKRNPYACDLGLTKFCAWYACDTTWTSSTRLSGSIFPSATGGNNEVYATNLSGVGIRRYNPHFPDASYPNERSGLGAYQWMDTSEAVDLIRLNTDKVTSGKLTSGMIVAYYANGTSIASLNLADSSVTFVACSLSTSNINVPLDPIASSAFTSVGTTLGEKPFNIGLKCDPGTRINATLSGTQNADTPTNTSVLALTNAGSANVASGVGIQLVYGSTPLKLGTRVLLRVSNGGSLEFPADAFKARYYQTKSDVTTGEANTTAVLDLTYQ